MNDWTPEAYLSAWTYATRVHDGQTYGGAENGEQVPYLNHLGMVAMEVIACLRSTPHSYDADLMVQCAILHDTIEDTEADFATIESRFGSKVAHGVSALSKNESLPSKEDQMRDSLQRILEQGAEVACVKVADRISNLYQPPFDWPNDKKRAYAVEAQLIRDTLSIADAQLLERLDQRIRGYARFYA